MAATVVFEERVEIPLTLRSLAEFRQWAQSAEFPERGRIDYLAGRIEVDMSPEDIFCHATLKTEIVGVLQRRIKRENRGYLMSDCTRVSNPAADLSVEPDVVFVSREAIDEGRIRLIPKAGAADRYVELEGAADLIVEIVSDRSVAKDTRRLPEAYFRAGVAEFWLFDVRGKTPHFSIHRRDPSGYEAVAADAERFQRSTVLNCRFRLDGARDARGFSNFDLREQD
jgi:Uma2 family endonuclease